MECLIPGLSQFVKDVVDCIGKVPALIQCIDADHHGGVAVRAGKFATEEYLIDDTLAQPP